MIVSIHISYCIIIAHTSCHVIRIIPSIKNSYNLNTQPIILHRQFSPINPHHLSQQTLQHPPLNSRNIVVAYTPFPSLNSNTPLPSSSLHFISLTHATISRTLPTGTNYLSSPSFSYRILRPQRPHIFQHQRLVIFSHLILRILRRRSTSHPAGILTLPAATPPPPVFPPSLPAPNLPPTHARRNAPCAMPLSCSTNTTETPSRKTPPILSASPARSITPPPMKRPKSSRFRVDVTPTCNSSPGVTRNTVGKTPSIS